MTYFDGCNTVLQIYSVPVSSQVSLNEKIHAGLFHPEMLMEYINLFNIKGFLQERGNRKV